MDMRAIWLGGITGVVVGAVVVGGTWAWSHRPGAPAGPASVARLQQDLATAKKSDEISRAANAQLQQTLAQRDAEIASLKSDTAFYEKFVGSAADRQALEVHAVRVATQAGNTWHFEALLAQSARRDGDSTGHLTVAVEGTRNGQLQKLAWPDLRQGAGDTGIPYSFRYFQRVGGDIALPEGFVPVRILVHLAPDGGAAVDSSVDWSVARSAP